LDIAYLHKIHYLHKITTKEPNQCTSTQLVTKNKVDRREGNKRRGEIGKREEGIPEINS
jgi:hypothetical protein